MLLVACAPAFGAAAVEMQPMFGRDRLDMTAEGVEAQTVSAEDKTLINNFLQSPEFKAFAEAFEAQSNAINRVVQLQAQAQNSNPVEKIANQIALDKTLEKVDELSQKQEELLKNRSPEKRGQVNAWAAQKARLGKLTDEQTAIQQSIKENADKINVTLKRKMGSNAKQELMRPLRQEEEDLKSRLKAVKQEKSQLANATRNEKMGLNRRPSKPVPSKPVNEDASALINVVRDLVDVQKLDPQTRERFQKVMDNDKLKDQVKYNRLLDIMARADAKSSKRSIKQVKEELNAEVLSERREWDKGMAEKWVSVALQSSNPQRVLNVMDATEKNPQASALAKSMVEARLWVQNNQDTLKGYMEAAHQDVEKRRYRTLDAAFRQAIRNEYLSDGALNQLVERMVKKGSAPVQQNMQQNTEHQVRALNVQQKQELATKLGVSVDRLDRVVSGQEHLSDDQLIRIGNDAELDLGVARSMKENSAQLKTDAEFSRDVNAAIARSMRDQGGSQKKGNGQPSNQRVNDLSVDEVEKKKFIEEDRGNNVPIDRVDNAWKREQEDRENSQKNEAARCDFWAEQKALYQEAQERTGSDEATLQMLQKYTDNPYAD
jgi:plasmid maintenance system antidote protein VapI